MKVRQIVCLGLASLMVTAVPSTALAAEENTELKDLGNYSVLGGELTIEKKTDYSTDFGWASLADGFTLLADKNANWYSTGANNLGQLGDGSTESRSHFEMFYDSSVPRFKDYLSNENSPLVARKIWAKASNTQSSISLDAGSWGHTYQTGSQWPVGDMGYEWVVEEYEWGGENSEWVPRKLDEPRFFVKAYNPVEFIPVKSVPGSNPDNPGDIKLSPRWQISRNTYRDANYDYLLYCPATRPYAYQVTPIMNNEVGAAYLAYVPVSGGESFTYTIKACSNMDESTHFFVGYPEDETDMPEYTPYLETIPNVTGAGGLPSGERFISFSQRGTFGAGVNNISIIT